MTDLLVDTDVLVDHLRHHRELRRGDNRLHISVVTRAELRAGRSGDDPAVGALLASLLEFPVDRPVADRAGRIRRTLGTAMADALVAATAVEHALTLVTRNRSHFDGIEGLVVSPPD